MVRSREKTNFRKRLELNRVVGFRLNSYADTESDPFLQL